jgi:hypothetical protein
MEPFERRVRVLSERMKTMTCELTDNRLDDYLDSALAETRLSGFERHLSDCSRCARRVRTAQVLRQGLSELPVEGPEPDFFERALATGAEKSRRPSGAPSSGSHWFGIAAAAAVIALVVFALPQTRIDTPPAPAGVAQVALAVQETRTINLVFASDEALDNVSLSVDLPDGIELAMYPGRERIQWSTRLQPGNNVLPLELVALGGTGGQLVATMRGDDREKVFRIDISILTG